CMQSNDRYQNRPLSTTSITYLLFPIAYSSIYCVIFVWFAFWWANPWMSETQMVVLALDIVLYAYYIWVVLDLLIMLLQCLYLFAHLACWTLQDLHVQIGHCLSAASGRRRASLTRHTHHYFLNHHRMSRMIF